MAASEALRKALLEGLVIPAHPLALTAERKLDERRQVALTRYYAEAGAGGIAVGVHSTQFAIRTAGLFEPVLSLAAETAAESERQRGRALVKIAGAIGPTAQAVSEAETACRLGYDAVLLSLGALRDASEDELVLHCRRVADVLPLVGFYLQPAVGGRLLDPAFWRRFLEIENVVADEGRPVQPLPDARRRARARRRAAAPETSRSTPATTTRSCSTCSPTSRGEPRVRFVGGLLGQWGVWTRRAVELLESVKRCRREGGASSLELLALGQQLTDANAALFDARNGFRGCIPGIHEVLRRVGLLAGRYCLDPTEELSPGPAAGDRPRDRRLPAPDRRRLRAGEPGPMAALSARAAHGDSVLAELVREQKRGVARGIASVCSAHPLVLQAAFEQALQDGSSVLVESTSNQVNQDGGYTGRQAERSSWRSSRGWRPKRASRRTA